MNDTIFDRIAENLARRPEAAVYLFEQRSISFREMDGVSGTWRAGLRALGLRPGDRVVLLMHDGPEMVAALLAVLGCGAIAVPCCTAATVPELAHILRDSGARFLIVTQDNRFFVEVLDLQGALPERTLLVGGAGVGSCIDFDAVLATVHPSVPDKMQSSDPALIIYTSGTTDAAKGALHRHGDITCTIDTARSLYGIGCDDRVFSASRMYFGYGFTNSFSIPLGLGACCILSRHRQTPTIMANIFERYRPNIFFGVPAHFRALLEHHGQGHALHSASIAFAISSGEKLPPQLFHRWNKATGATIIDMLGTTELLYAFISNRKGRIRPGSCGTAVEGYDIRLIDDRGSIVAGEGSGTLHVRGKSGITQYWNRPDKTDETIRGGWINTGDLFRRDGEGYYYFESRVRDAFKSSGQWVSPSEVEDVLCAHTDVLEAAIIPEEGPDGELRLIGIIVPRPGAEPDQVRQSILDHAASNLPRYKRPTDLRFVPALPRTPTGKLQRFKLRTPEADPRADAATAA